MKIFMNSSATYLDSNGQEVLCAKGTTVEYPEDTDKRRQGLKYLLDRKYAVPVKDEILNG